MKILQYNILDGCCSTERFSKLDTWMKNKEYDLVGFNEVNGWTKKSFQETATSWGYKYSYLFQIKTSPYFIGVISKFPINVLGTYESPFHHGLLHIKMKDIHFFITHLKPFDSFKREEEATFIVNLVKSIKEPSILMGDLNTLSPLDKKFYDENETLKQFALNKRFSREIHDLKINYNPMRILLNGGFYDVIHGHSFNYTIPTLIDTHHVSPIKRRIDYILVNKYMFRYDSVASVVRDSTVETLSDHYPVECVFKDG